MPSEPDCRDCRHLEPIRRCPECGHETGGELCLHPQSRGWSRHYMRSTMLTLCARGRLFEAKESTAESAEGAEEKG